MTLDEAKAALAKCTRDELRDHAFSDAEVHWEDDAGFVVAYGYFGLDLAEVVIGTAVFNADDARVLRSIGKRGVVERNDTPRCPLCDLPRKGGCGCVAEILAEAGEADE